MIQRSCRKAITLELPTVARSVEIEGRSWKARREALECASGGRDHGVRQGEGSIMRRAIGDKAMAGASMLERGLSSHPKESTLIAVGSPDRNGSRTGKRSRDKEQ
jgi:hypothetical protein